MFRILEVTSLDLSVLYIWMSSIYAVMISIAHIFLTLKSEQYELLFGFCNLVLMILRLLIAIWIVSLHLISQIIIAFLKLVKDNFQNNVFDNIVNVFDSTRMLIEKKYICKTY